MLNTEVLQSLVFKGGGDFQWQTLTLNRRPLSMQQ